MFKEFIKDVTQNSVVSSPKTIVTSTPTNNTLDNTLAPLEASPVRKLPHSPRGDTSMYKSLEQSQTLTNTVSTNVADTEKTVYKSLDESTNLHSNNPFEDTEEDEGVEPDASETSENEQPHVAVKQIEPDDHLKDVYSSAENDEAEGKLSDQYFYCIKRKKHCLILIFNNSLLTVSEREDDEETYIVYNSNNSEAIFLTKSSKFLRERDPLTERYYIRKK